MTRGKRRPPAASKLPVDPTRHRPAKVALHMLLLGYDHHYVALWLWHMTRVEADVGVPATMPAVWQ